MGLFRKLRKVVKKVVKTGLKTAPLWSSFVPGGGFAMTVLKSGLKMGAQRGNTSPSAKNRFPLPNAYMQPSVTARRAILMHQVAPAGRAAGPYSSRYGMMMKQRSRLGGRTRLVALRGRALKMRRRVA